MGNRHASVLSFVWLAVFAASVLWFSSAPIPGWLLAIVVSLAIPFGLAARYPRLMPRWLAQPPTEQRPH